MKRIIVPFVLLVAVLSLNACNKNKEKEVIGFKPIYTSVETIERIEINEDEPLEMPGKIYVYENYLLVNDQSKGIHIFDNSNPSAPVKLSFIGIPGNMDFSVRNNILYADNISDMVLFDISQPSAPIYKNRIKSVFPTQLFPDQAGQFECVDPSKGVVLRWEKVVLTNPGCSK
ncbi:MAG: hypothetical protein AB8B74_04575 [Crocinitomicaceae bacterium]